MREFYRSAIFLGPDWSQGHLNKKEYAWQRKEGLAMTLWLTSDFGFSVLPYCPQIKLQDHHGNGMKNRKVYLIIKFMRRRLIKMYITDGNGRASFNLDTTAWNSSSVFLEVNLTSAHRRVKSLKLCQCSLLLPAAPWQLGPGFPTQFCWCRATGKVSSNGFSQTKLMTS